MAKTNLQAEILAELECLVCIEIMAPPIRMCVLGHSICNSCSDRLDTCPKCRSDLSEARNFSLENIYYKLCIPCKYEECKAQVRGSDLNDHQDNCDYALTNCPLNSINNCSWHGQKRQILDHCQKKHINNVFFAYKQHILWIKCNGRKYLYGDSCCFLMQAHDGLFKCYCEFDPSKKVAKWAVVHLGPQKNADKFYYEIGFANSDMVLSSPCQPDNKKWFPHESSVVSDMEILQKFFGPRGLGYSVTIRQREVVEEEVTPCEFKDNPMVPLPSRFYDIDHPTSLECKALMARWHHSI